MKKNMIMMALVLSVIGCSWNHPSGSTTANRRCNTYTEWDDCAIAPNCMQARAWYTENGEFKETFVCVYKHARGGKR
jgi:hypothetical protein